VSSRTESAELPPGFILDFRSGWLSSSSAETQDGIRPVAWVLAAPARQSWLQSANRRGPPFSLHADGGACPGSHDDFGGKRDFPQAASFAGEKAFTRQGDTSPLPAQTPRADVAPFVRFAPGAPPATTSTHHARASPRSPTAAAPPSCAPSDGLRSSRCSRSGSSP